MNDENTAAKIVLLINRFVTAAMAHQRALEELDETRASAHVRIITGLVAAIAAEGVAGQEALLALTASDNKVAAGLAAIFAMHYDPPRCLKTLRRLAAEKGLLGFRASVAIERWEKGEWPEH